MNKFFRVFLEIYLPAWSVFALISAGGSLATAIGQEVGKVQPTPKSNMAGWVWQVNINGTNYDFNQMEVAFLRVLDSTNINLQWDWLSTVEAANRGRYFQSNTITRLIQKYQTEQDAPNRREIFTIIEQSRDPRFKEICALAQNDSDPWISKRARGSLSTSSITFYDPDAKEFQIDGVKYDLQQAQAGLFQALDSTNAELKQKWLRAVVGFRTGLQTSIVPKLIRQFQTERDPKVREAILHTIQFSRDPKLVDVCLSAQNDSSASVRLLAGALLIMENRIQGVEVVTRCLPGLNDLERQHAMQVVGEAVGKFGFEFKPATVVNSPEPTHAEIETLVSEWTKWWSENGQRFNPSK
jgi:hypothetical protein